MRSEYVNLIPDLRLFTISTLIPQEMALRGVHIFLYTLPLQNRTRSVILEIIIMYSHFQFYSNATLIHEY